MPYQYVKEVIHNVSCTSYNRTHQRKYSGFFIVCDVILPLVSNMEIDSQGEITLTRFKGKVVKMDHRMLKLEVDLIFHKEKLYDRIEFSNVRNKKCQQVFSEFTSKGDMFSKCFITDNVNVNIQFQRWQRRFKRQ